MFIGLLTSRLAPYAVAALVALGGFFYVSNLKASVRDTREELGAERAIRTAAQAQALALSHELDAAQTALVARDRQIAEVRQALASSSAQLRRVARRPEVAKWAGTTVPDAVASLLRGASSSAGAGAQDGAAGGAAGDMPERSRAE